MPINLKRLQQDFAAAAKDGQISTAEVDGLIKRARAGGLTESEAKALKRETARYRDSFTPEASQKLAAFIKDKMGQLEILDDPTPTNPLGKQDPAVLPGDRKKVRQEVIAGGELVRSGISGDDPMQNYLGDCYLIGAMSAVAKQNPQAIADAFKKNADGTYTVRIFEQRGRALRPTYVTVDADLPRNNWNGNIYAYARDQKELWPALLEKAFAAKAGSYGALEGGVPGDAMTAITGKPSEDLDLRARGVKAEAVFEQLKAAVKAKKPATAATLGESSAAKYANTHVYADHTYAVWGVSEVGGVKYVQLRNPWGESEPAGNGKDDGIFKLELGEFMRLFGGVSVNG